MNAMNARALQAADGGVMRLPTKTVEKVWGCDLLPPPFVAPKGQRIGEIWFDPPAEFDQLLAKYLFTSEKLSVQVHPGERHAPAGMSGKDECWLVTSVQPGAKLAIGLKHKISRGHLEEAARDGTIEELLSWYHAAPGDFFYLPAGTIHAIGPGLGLIEVQQNSDITYRLYDYGRPRELHLEQALKVAIREPYPAHCYRKAAESGPVTLLEGPHFRVDRLDGPADAKTLGNYNQPTIVLPVDGPVMIGGEQVEAGECAIAPALSHVSLSPGVRVLIARP